MYPLYQVYRRKDTPSDKVLWPGALYEARGFEDALRKSLDERPHDPALETHAVVVNVDNPGNGAAIFRIDTKREVVVTAAITRTG